MRHIKLILSIWATSIIYLFGGFDVSLNCLITLMVADYITGVSKAYYNSELSSYKGIKGIIKKLNILTLVVVSNMIDNLLGSSGAIRTLMIYYICANEGLSILENLSVMNIIVPKWFKEKLEQVKQIGENSNGSST